MYNMQHVHIFKMIGLQRQLWAVQGKVLHARGATTAGPGCLGQPPKWHGGPALAIARWVLAGPLFLVSVHLASAC